VAPKHAQIADKELPKSRRQQRLEKSAPTNDEYVAPLQENALKRKRDQVEQEQDPKLKEFLQVYQPPSKTNIWTNGDTQADVPIAAVEHSVENIGMPEDESDDDYQVITKRHKATIGPATTVVEVGTVTDERDTEPVEDKSTQKNDHDMEGVEETTEVDHGPISDADWLRSRTNRVLDLVADDEQPSLDAPLPVVERAMNALPDSVDQSAGAEPSSEQQVDVPSSTEVDKIQDTGRLYLRNLHFDVTEDELREHFSKYGLLEEVSDPSPPLLLFPLAQMMNIQDRDN
jgi:multiple RNA-binding domain-containing protein 1